MPLVGKFRMACSFEPERQGVEAHAVTAAGMSTADTQATCHMCARHDLLAVCSMFGKFGKFKF